MKFKNGEIFAATKPLEELLKQKFPVKTSYGIAKLASKINIELKAVEEVRIGLVKKYGKENDKGNIEIQPDSPNWPLFAKEFDELMDQDVEFVFDKVKIPSEVDGKSILIEPEVFMTLDKFVEVT